MRRLNRLESQMRRNKNGSASFVSDKCSLDSRKKCPRRVRLSFWRNADTNIWQADTHYTKKHQKMSQVSVHLLFITWMPQEKDLQKQVHEVHTTSSASFIVSHIWLTIISRATFSFSDGICLNWYMYFSKLLHGFSKVVLNISRPLPNKTKLNFDQYFKACWGQKKSGTPFTS